MYGLLIESIVETIKAKYGAAIWEQVKKKAKIDNQFFSTHQQYSETVIQRIVKHLSDLTGQTPDAIMDMLGVEFVNYVAQYGYDRILRVLGRHLRDFLNGLDNLHEYMRFSYPKLKPPSFFVEQETSSGLVLHYRSKRKGFVHYVKGQIRQVAKVFYNTTIHIEVVSEKQEMDLTHVIFKLTFENKHYQNQISSTSSSDCYLKGATSNLPIRSEVFFELFPFHIVFKKDLEVISLGDGLKQAMKHAEGESIRDVFNLIRPLINFNWDSIISHTNNVFELTTIEPVRRPDSPSSQDPTNTILNSFDTQHTDSSSRVDECLKLRGQMMFIDEWDAMIFLATPVLENLDTMFQTGFYINDLSMHDSSRDLVLVGTQQSAELKLALDQEKHKSKALEESMKKLDVEMKRTDQLLYQMIPKKIADRLRSGEPVMNLCEVFSSCTILFSDVVGFTSTCSQLAPMEVVSMLNEMYTKFDKCLELHSVYKVETIGDAYMVVSGLPERTNNHAVEIIDMAFDMLAAISTLKNPATGESMMIRIGCHSGPAVAGVVGLKMPRYCLFGDTVNTASRMESTSEAMRIHISQSTKNAIDNQPYRVVERGKIEVKGKGEMKTYFVLCKINEDGKSIKCPFMEIFEAQKKAEESSFFEHNEKKPLEIPPESEDVDAEPEPEKTDKQADNDSIASRGYSPVMMNDVKKSHISLRDTKNQSPLEQQPHSQNAIEKCPHMNGVSHHIEILGPNENSANLPNVNFNNNTAENLGEKKVTISAHKRETNYKYEENGKGSSLPKVESIPNAHSISMEILESKKLHSVQMNHNDSNSSLINGKSSGISSSNNTDLSKSSQNSTMSKKNKSLACQVI